MDNVTNAMTKAKMSGYLHLKTKRRMLSSWKTYWFVLEDRLLLYYRSKDESRPISPCKGSINLGLPCELKCISSVSNAFQIVTRTTTYTLKADNADDQKKWMQMLLSILTQSQNQAAGAAKPPNLSTCLSLDQIFPEIEPGDSKILQKPRFERQNTMPHKLKNESEIIQRLQKLGAQSYGGSLEAITKVVKKSDSPELSTRKSATASRGSLPDHYYEYQQPDLLRGRCPVDNIYERISGDSQISRRDSFLVDNDNYSVTLRRPSAAISHRETRSLLVENDQYITRRQVISDEVIYAEPKINHVTDCNKNSVVIENNLYARSNSENVYEDLDMFNPYSKPTSSTENNKKSKVPKSKSFIKRVWKKRHKKETVKPEEKIYDEINDATPAKFELSDGNAVQMLHELHNILESKKTKLEAVASTSSQSEQHDEACSELPTSPQLSEPQRPLLPPKTLNKASPRANPFGERVRSLDEILEDLDREQIESKTKVQVLIEKFNEPDEVVLRNPDRSGDDHRHSDELNHLLEQLTKVTCAPIMTPGVTSSLMNPTLGDEWLKLLPRRERRLSEPDYDVPRPHNSLQLPLEMETKSDAIPATRFFGPVLPSDSKEDNSWTASMTPDSLEVQPQHSHTLCSFDSHRYVQPNGAPREDPIYASPKSYTTVATHVFTTCSNICSAPDECTIIYKNVKTVTEEIFTDSLELCNESSTGF